MTRERIAKNLYRNGLGKFEDIRTHADGKQRLVTLQARTKTEALREQRALAVKFDRGELLPPTDKTVRAVADEWLAQLSVRPRTRESYDYHLRKNILPRLEHRKIQTVTPQDVGALIAWLRDERKVSSRTQAAAITTLNGLMSHAVWTKVIASNPVAAVPKSKRPKKLTHGGDFRVLESVEIEKLLAEVPEGYRTLVTLAVWSGMRESELLGLRWDEVDLKAGKIHLSRQLSRPRADHPAERVPLKTGTSRDIEIDAGLVTILREHRERQFALGFAKPTDYVFCTLPDGRPIHQRNLGKAFAKAADRAGLNPDGKRRLRFHDLRATYVSVLIEAGASAPYIGGQVGHSNPSITYAAYARLFNKEGQGDKAMAALQAARGVGNGRRNIQQGSSSAK